MKNKTYFKEGKWAIVSYKLSRVFTKGISDYGYMDHFSSIQHSCKIFGRGHITHPSLTWKVVVPICSKCHEEVPEGIMGLWTLHNWDRMQSMRAAEGKWTGRPGQVWEYSTTLYAPNTGPQ